MGEALYTVWVGGVEVCDHYLPYAKAVALACQYEALEYEDVFFEQIKED